MSGALSGRGESGRHHARIILPAGELTGELLSSGGGEAIELRFAIRVRHSPLLGEKSFLLESMERRIERAFADGQAFAGREADPASDRVAVHRAPAERLEDDE